jgi:diguanylate cyclase (GGDEF)-like protein
VATVAYILPFLFGAPRPVDAFGAVILIIPVGILAGEVIARNAADARRLAEEQRSAVAALARSNLTDDLTGLGNRRHGNQLLDSLAPGDTIAVLDLDRFKQVNDVHGHARGDALLQDLGEFLRTSLRSGDEAARMGGEEFLIVLRQAAVADSRPILARLLDNWRAREPLSTLSVGVAGHDGADSPLDVYRSADDALYRAKQNGRDRIVYADSSDATSRATSGTTLGAA